MSTAPQVIVVGGGLSGLSAAHTLYERGANVLMLDKNGFFGGNSTKATSGINGAGTVAQATLGIKDSVQAFFDDTKESARGLGNDDLMRVVTGNSGDCVNWLINKFKLDLSQVARLGGHSFERTHRGAAQFPGMTITYALMEGLEDLAESDPARVKIIKKANVVKLLQDSTGGVIGVEYTINGETRTAHGSVILATGGYAADFAKDGMLAKWRPDLVHLPTTNGDHCTGDGQKMAIAIGGSGIDLDKVQVHPTGLVDPNEPDAKVKFLAAEALRGVGGLLLDSEGNRFADELGHRDYVTGRMWSHAKGTVRLVLNGQASKEIEWHCKHYCGRGLMKRFETGAELAKEMGLSEKRLSEVFAQYVAVAKKPETDPFGKRFFHNTDWSMTSGPFNVAVMTPVLHYTMGGLEIDTNSRIINTNGQPIKGLYGCGELISGTEGANRLGGSGLLGCVVFGRVAGDSAAAYTLEQVSSASANSIATSRLDQVSKHLLATTVRVDPESKKVYLEFSWDAPSAASSAAVASTTASAQPQARPQAQIAAAPAEAKVEEVKQKEYTLAEVAKHNTKDDCWVVVNGQVLDATKFLPDHPGGPKAIMLFAGRDATEEFNMIHDKKVVAKYASETIIGTLKA